MARQMFGGWAAAAAAAASLVLAPVLAPVVARAEQASPAAHVVEAGETLSQIADNLGVDADTLARLNNLDDVNLLVVGQSLKLPATRTGAAVVPASVPARAPAPAPPTAPVRPSTPPPPTTPRSYAIADGDTLWSIAQQFSTTTAALVEANKLDDPNHLVAGAP